MKIVISLGGSLIVPKCEIDYKFLKSFKTLIEKLAQKHKFVIVTGGGHTARMYIEPLRKENLSEERACLIGIKTTKLNAMFLSNFLNANKMIPDKLKEIENSLRINNIVVCGALGYRPDMTSDGDAALIARYVKADMFINMTNVTGLYDKDPNKFKNAKFIPRISREDFWKIASKIEFKAGQHFVLDQSAARLLRTSKIKTIILDGKNLKNFEKCIEKKKFTGTIIG